MSAPGEKEKVLEKIAALAKKYGVGIDEIASRMAKDVTKTPQGSNSVIVKLLSYVGGVLIFAGLGAYISLVWDDLGSAARVIITFGPGLVALILGVVALKDARYQKAATPLFMIAAFLEPTGLFVFLREYFEGDNPTLAAMIVFGPLAIQMGLIFWKTQRTSLLFFTIFYGFAFFGAAMDQVEIKDDWISVALGLSGLLISQALNKTIHRSMVPFFYFIFALVMAGGAFSILVDEKPLDFGLIGISAVMVYASVVAQSRAFLVASVITMLGYIGYFTNEYFANMVGWPIALIVMGFIMVGLSAYAVKLSKKITA